MLWFAYILLFSSSFSSKQYKINQRTKTVMGKVPPSTRIPAGAEVLCSYGASLARQLRYNRDSNPSLRIPPSEVPDEVKVSSRDPLIRRLNRKIHIESEKKGGRTFSETPRERAHRLARELQTMTTCPICHQPSYQKNLRRHLALVHRTY